MTKEEFKKVQNIYFIGIGGISMSGLAKILTKRGIKVSGSDRTRSEQTTELENSGIKVFYGQRAGNIDEKIDLVVYTAAISEDNEEYAEAKRLNIPIMSRATLLGHIMGEYTHSLGVAGTDGKTTTTAMISYILLCAELDPTVFVGGNVGQLGGNVRIGKQEYCVSEACEYKDSFLELYPTDEIILNIEPDHLDYFKNIEGVRKSFTKYASEIPQNGTLIINGDINKKEEIIKEHKGKYFTYGIVDDVTAMKPDGTCEIPYDTAAVNLSYNERGCGLFDLYDGGKYIAHMEMNIIGRHNVSNALAAIKMALVYGVDIEKIKEALRTFTGVNRRFEYKGEINGISIYDDYAHSPKEISATLAAARRIFNGRLVTIFQPHTYSRTKYLFDEFVESLSMSDVVVLADIYAARENNDVNISSKDIRDSLEQKGIKSYYFSSFDDIEKFLLENSSTNDMLITMGAGDIVKIGDRLLGK